MLPFFISYLFILSYRVAFHTVLSVSYTSNTMKAIEYCIECLTKLAEKTLQLSSGYDRNSFPINKHEGRKIKVFSGLCK